MRKSADAAAHSESIATSKAGSSGFRWRFRGVPLWVPALLILPFVLQSVLLHAFGMSRYTSLSVMVAFAFRW